MKCHTHDHQMSKGRERERARHQRHLAPCYFSSWCCEIARLQFAGKDATHVIEKLMASLEKAKQERRAAAEALALVVALRCQGCHQESPRGRVPYLSE